MDVDQPPSALLAVPPEIHLMIGKSADASSRIALANCSKYLRHVMSQLVFKKIRFQGTEKEVCHHFRLYLANQGTLPMDDVRRLLKSLRITVTESYHFSTPSFARDALPGLLQQTLQASPNVEVLTLDLDYLEDHQSSRFAESLIMSPKVKHLRVIAPDQITATILERCTPPGELVSLHVDLTGTYNQGTHIQAVTGLQPNLQRLCLSVRIDMLAYSDGFHLNAGLFLIDEAAIRFPSLEWLVLAPYDIWLHSPNKIDSIHQQQMLETRLRRFYRAAKRIPSLRRLAFALPSTFIGERVISGRFDGPSFRATRVRINGWYYALLRDAMSRIPCLEQLSIFSSENKCYTATRRPGEELISTKGPIRRRHDPVRFPFALIE